MTDLAEFFKKKRAESELTEAKGKEIIDDWLKTLTNFFATVREWLEPSRSAGLEIAEHKADFNEEYLGKYSTPYLVLSFGGRFVHIRPIARLIMGALGRVDINSPKGEVRLLYQGESKGWFIFMQDKKDLILTQDLFNQIIQDAFS